MNATSPEGPSQGEVESLTRAALTTQMTLGRLTWGTEGILYERVPD
jgi:hypothetical protein